VVRVRMVDLVMLLVISGIHMPLASTAW
jgi:hypothetical protein